MLLFLYQNLFKIIHKIIQLIVKPDLLRKCESCRDLKKIDLLDKNIPKCKYIDIGFTARAQINELKKNDVVSNVKVAFSVGWFCLSHQLWENI